MGSRKEHIKKSLGISEYPWSSDDDDSQQSVPDVHLLRRQSAVPRPSVADMPGTSGQTLPPSSTLPPGKRNQAEMFWSLMNPPQKIPMGVARSRLFEAPPRAPINTPVTELRAQRPQAVADIQRMLAIKKLTRTLGTVRPHKPNASVYSISRSLSGPSRNPIFNPSISTSDGAVIKQNYRNNALKRLQACRNIMPAYSYSSRCTPSSSSSGMAMDELLAPSSAFTRLVPPPVPVSVEPAVPTEPIVVIDSPVVERSEQAPENDCRDHSVQEPTRDENVAGDDEAIEVMDTSHNTTGGSGVSLEEEIVEIDAHEETDGNTNVENSTEIVINADVSLNEIHPAASNEEAEALQQQNIENNKRRREENISPDDAEPYTVKEFNQSLLRLLECPVCLEWMEPPMSQCRRGHLVCGRCRERLASCPVCRTTFSSVRNRAMEGVAEMVRYPCRHGCGREVRLRRRGTHEASCGARRYVCPAPACAHRPPLPRDHLPHHFQSKHMSILKIGRKHKFSMKVNSEQHDTWVVAAMHEYFSLRVDVDIRTWGVVVYVAYIGPKCNARNFIYEVSVVGQHNSRKLVYTRATHCDLESSSLNVSRQDCFHLTLDQALNFLRVKNRHCEPDKFLDFNVEISKSENVNRDDSDS